MHARPLRGLAVALGSFALGGGLVSLLGWLTGHYRLTDWGDSGISIKANAAVAAVASGAGVVLLAVLPRARWAIRIAGILSTVIAALTAFEHASGMDLGIDTLLADEPAGARATAAPGRMGPPACTSFLLIGLALWLMTLGNRARALAAGLAIATTAISLLSLTGYIYGAELMYSAPRFSGISVQTSAMIFALGLGLLLNAPEQKPMSVILDAGAAGILARRILPLIVVLPIAIGWWQVLARNADWYDVQSRSAVRTLLEVALLGGLLWWSIDQVRAYETAVREGERRLAETLANITDGFVTFDSQWRVTFVNAEATRLMGKSQTELLGKVIWEVYPENVGGAAYRKLHRAARSRTSVEYEEFNPALQRWLANKAYPAADGGMAVYFHDITRRKQIEAALLAKERQLQHVSDNAAVMVAQCSRDLRYVYVNKTFADSFGRSIQEILDRPIPEVLGKEGYETIRPFVERVLAGERVEFEARVPRDASGLRWVRGVYVPDRDAQGRICGWIAALTDITDRKQTEEALRRSEERLRKIVNIEGVGVMTFDYSGTFLFANDAFLQMFGYTREEFESRTFTWRDFTPPEHVKGSEHEFEQLEKTGQIGPYEKEYLCKDGSRKWMMFVGADLGDGTLVEYGIDVSARRLAEAQLREHEQTFRTLVEQVQDYAIFMLDTQSRATTWNEGVRRVLGFEETEFLGKDVSGLIFTPEDIAQGIPQWELQESAANGKATNDRWMRRKDGTRFWSAGMTTALRSDSGVLLGYMKVMRDQTEQKQLEQQLRTIAAELSEANRRKDEFLATLAHELRNPLAPIRTGLELMKMARDDAAIVEETRRTMERQTRQLIMLVDDLLDVSRLTRGTLKLRRRLVELHDVIRSVLEASRPFIDQSGHALTVELPAEEIHLDADPNRLEQVLSNLLNNAAKYTPAGGRIWLSAHPQQDQVVISVRDNGLGIPDDMLDRVFEMFGQVNHPEEYNFSGLGIGLALVKSLVELHGGTVSARSDGPGKGSEFVVRLPTVRQQRPRETSLEGDQPSADTIAGLRILVVDDSQEAAIMLSMVMQRLGNELRTAFDGQEAVEAAEDFRPDVVIMDIGMPRMNGYQAARNIRQQPWGQHMTLIALTGWGQEEDKQRTRQAGFDHHLVKPPDLSLLRRILAEVRDERAAR